MQFSSVAFTSNGVPVKIKMVSEFSYNNATRGDGVDGRLSLKCNGKLNHSGSIQAKLSRNSNVSETLKKWVPSSFTGQQCRNAYCSEFLSKVDSVRFKYCSNITTGQFDQITQCNFINQTNRRPVALVSFPGSGNTWVRGLIHASTGICTGSIYCDISLRTRGFVGEYIRGGAVLVVKTHKYKPQWIQMKKLDKDDGLYESGILIVRNPFDAMVAEWNRIVGNNFNRQTIILDSHIKSAGKDWFGK